MTRSVDRASLAGGLGLVAVGGVLLADQSGAYELSPSLAGAVLAIFLATTGLALLWRRPAPQPLEGAGTGDILRSGPAGPRPRERSERERLRDLYRGGFGVALIAGAALVVLWRVGGIGALGDTLVTIVVVVMALVLILAPFWWRLGRGLAAERAERIRSQERAEVAAHIHDSVLQTLTLVQKRAGDPREVTQLARSQERELRAWLFDERGQGASDSLAAALETAAAHVEDDHRVPVEVVAVGDAPADARSEPLVAAAREAMVNAAKFAPDAGEIAVYAELGIDGAQVFVRDRGGGFDPDGVPADRRGIRESIIGRMERAGGRATIRSSERGTEVELELPGTPP